MKMKAGWPGLLMWCLAALAAGSQELADRRLREGLKLLERGRLRDARAELQAALALEPERADILEALARAERGEVRPAVEASPSPSPESGDARQKAARELEEARRAYRDSDLGRAREAWIRALRLDQDNAEAREGLARLEAEAYRADPDAPFDSSVRDLYEAALREARKDRLLEASRKLREALTLNPDQPQVKALLTRIEAGAFAQAGSREIEERLAEAARRLEAGELAQARAAYEEVLRLKPADSRAQEGLNAVRTKAASRVEALMLQAAKSSGEEALALYRQVLELDPSHAEARRGAERAAKSLERSRQSAAFKQKVKESYNRGVEAWQSGDLAAAARHFREVLELAPQDQDAARALKLVEEKLGSTVDRVQADAQALLSEARELERQGRLKEALQAYERAAARDRLNAEARQSAERLRAEMAGE